MSISREVKNTESKRAGCFSLSHLLLLFMLLLTLCTLPACARTATPDPLMEKQAQALNSLGLFSGTDKGFELERTPTRGESLVMLLKLTGQAQQAEKENLPHPFTDGGWASPFIGYGYTHKYTSGVSDTEFGTAQPATAQQYAVFLLRALGYTINEDYSYDKALSFFLSHAPALTPAVEDFTRGDMAAMSMAALAAPMKDGSGTLAEKLSSQGLFSMEDYRTARDGAIPAAEKDVTILAYIVGSDLESGSGFASDDIAEMLEADLGGSLNLVLQTGGTNEWENDWMTGKATQRFQVTDDDVIHLATLEDALMSQPDTLANFLRWGVTNYPAQRYILLFWSHGEGTINGFGVDEVNNGKTLSLGEMSRAFDWADAHFELVAFDACLMSTLTNAYMLRDHADYLLASEELMSLSGFRYEKWLTALAETPDMSVEELSQHIMLDYLKAAKKQLWNEVTLSLTDLSKIEPVMQQWKAILKQLAVKLELGQYYNVENAISQTREYAYLSMYDQFDFIDALNHFETFNLIQAETAKNAADQAILMARSQNVDIANGLAVYLPFTQTDNYYNGTRNSLLECGFEKEDLVFFDLLCKERETRNQTNP